MTVALLFVAILLVLGVLLRQRLAIFRWLYIPASVIAGMVGLLVIQALYVTNGQLNQWAESVSGRLSSWPGWLIAVVFAGMLLVRKPTAPLQSVRRVAQQGLMVWVIVLGETAVGLWAVWLLVQPFYDVPNSLGMLIETGFAGGHGTAAAMGEVFAHPQVGLQGGKDLGMLMATFGLVFGIVAGILWINIGVRRGWVDPQIIDAAASNQPGNFGSIGQAKISGDSIDPLLLQLLWLSLAFGIGMLMQFVVLQLAGSFDGGTASVEQTDAARRELSKRLTLTNMVDFPLFIYTLFGGLIVYRMMKWLGAEDLIDAATINRLTSTAMDILVVAAIASLNLGVVVAMAVPFVILFCCGVLWTAFCLLVLARWILPREYWFELGLINYGMSTGTTATGFVLLKMVDPDLKSGAAEDYALAAPLSAPFIGGGILTIALPLLVLERIPVSVPALSITAIVVVLIVLAIRLASSLDSVEHRAAD